MILIFISGLSSKVKIKVKSDVNPQRLQLRGGRKKKKTKEEEEERRERRWTRLYYSASRSPKYPREIEKQHN